MLENFDENRIITSSECLRRIANLQVLIDSQERSRDFAIQLRDSDIHAFISDCESRIQEHRIDILSWKIREAKTL